MCAIMNGIAYARRLPPERRDVPRLRRLLPPVHPPRGAQPPARHLRLHARQRRRRRGRPDPPAGRDHPRPARDPEPRRHPPGRSRGDRGRLRRRARAHRRPDAARAHAAERPRSTGRREDAARRRPPRAATSLVKETAPLEPILLSAGQRGAARVAAAKELGAGTRVVSLPCLTRFERQPAAYREEVLPKACRRRVSIEAGVTLGWERWVGDAGRSVGIDHFGASAPGRGPDGEVRDQREECD